MLIARFFLRLTIIATTTTATRTTTTINPPITAITPAMISIGTPPELDNGVFVALGAVDAQAPLEHSTPI